MRHRRDVLKAGLALVGSSLLGCGSQSSTPGGSSSGTSPTAEVGFLQAPVRSAQNGLLDTSLSAQMGTNTVGGVLANTRTYDGKLVGPTLRVRPGDTLRFNLFNNLPINPDEYVVPVDMNAPHLFNTTNNHTHGLHVPPDGNADNVFVSVPPGSSFQYEYNIPTDHPPGTFWYHPHHHGSVAEQVFGGMNGALIVEGGIDDLPEVREARDLIYLIGELNIDPATGQVPPFVTTQPQPFPFAGRLFPLAHRLLIVNGNHLPTLVARSGEVIRLRVINGSVRTNIPFAIDGHELHVAALDGITLSQLRTVATQPLAVSGRADIFLKVGAPGTYTIRKLLDNFGPAPDPEVILGTLEVVGPAVSMQLPTRLIPPASLPDIASSEITARRTMTFSVVDGGPGGFPNFRVNDVLFDADVINHTIPLNAVEEWTLINTSLIGHPFHIHINPFQVIAINGVPLPRPEWLDNVLIPKRTADAPGTVTIRQRFKDFKGLFVFHCHILAHEDLGMMQTINVV